MPAEGDVPDGVPSGAPVREPAGRRALGLVLLVGLASGSGCGDGSETDRAVAVPAVTSHTARLIGAPEAGPVADDAGGCDDAHDDDGRVPDSLGSPPVLPPGTTRIERSLCGFYDADLVEFTALADTAYRIEVLNHRSPRAFGVYLQLLERGEDGALGLVRQSSPGDVVLDHVTTGRERAHVVRVASTASDIGQYGGGDYTLSIEIGR